VEASLQDIETIKNNIALQIAQQYLNVMLNREIKKISESAMDNAQKLYDRAKITTDVGTQLKRFWQKHSLSWQEKNRM
jgi:outer membrane protein